MDTLELFLIAVGLSMDAFAISVCKGLSLKKVSLRHMLLAGAWFGVFQALMPLAGFALGTAAASLISRYSHWVAFVLLAIIGVNMIREAFESKEELDNKMDPLTMLMLAVATSIDALAVGASFAFMQVKIIPAVLLIGTVTFVISAAGVKIGSLFGDRWHKKAEITGGVILILIGCRLMLEGLGII